MSQRHIIQDESPTNDDTAQDERFALIATLAGAALVVGTIVIAIVMRN